MQINEVLYFRSPRLATRFQSTAANIAKVLVKALLINFNIQENQVVKNSQDHISSVFSLKIHRQNNKNVCGRRIYHHVSCSQLFGFFPLGLCRRQPRNRQIHRQVCWKRHRISGVVGKERNIVFFCIPRKSWAKMVSEVPKMMVLWNFATKSRLKASSGVWRNLLPYIFQGGLQPGSPCRRAAPARVFCKFCRPLCMFIVVYIGLINQLTLENKTVKGCHYTAHTQSNENVQLGFGLDIADLQLLVEWHTNCDGKYLGQFYSLFNLKNIF